MDKICGNDFLLEKFKDIQELIRFADQKVAVVLVFIGLEITAVLGVLNNYTPKNYLNFGDITLLFFVILFFGSVAWCLYIATIKILCPRFALSDEKYKESDNPFYFGDISKATEEEFIVKAKEITKEDINISLSKELHACSKILVKKLLNCNKLIIKAFCSFLFMLAIIIWNVFFMRLPI